MVDAGADKISIGFFGNVANCLFEIASALRAEGGIDAHLYIDHAEGIAGRPESADPSLNDGYPDWIHDGRWIEPASIARPWRSPIARALARHDLCIVSGVGPMFAQFTGRPWCWWVSGGDLTVKPFPLAFLDLYPGIEHKVGQVIAGGWQRRAARRADQIWAQPFAPINDALGRLRVNPDRVAAEYFPLIVDTDEFRPDRTDLDDDESLRRVREAEFVVFHPSRFLVRSTRRRLRAGQFKGNDVLLRGFAEFVANHRDIDALLVMPDAELSRDLQQGKQLVRDLGIEANVHWAVPREREGFRRHDLVAYYDASDVVVDEFGVGWFGFVALEGSAMARPVLTHVDDEVMAILYDDDPPPFCNARTPEGVAGWLTELALDSQLRAERGRRARDWVVAHHSRDAARRRYSETVRRVVAGLQPGRSVA